MEKFLAVLTLIGFVVMVFSIWSFLSIRKHIKQFKNNSPHTNSLTDEKYFELKSRQDFIVAVATIIFALLSFLGYSTISNIRSELDKQFQSQKDSINILNSIANGNYKGLQKIGTNYQDTVRESLKLVSLLKQKMSLISNKDIINQNIFIVDPLRMGDFPIDKSDKYNEGFHLIKFNQLTTILGKRLPVFKIPPSIICFSSNMGGLKIKEITPESFIIQLESFSPSNDHDKGENVKFTVWISQKPEGINNFPIANAGIDQTLQLEK